MKSIESEALFEKPFLVNSIIISDKDENGNYTITTRQQKRGRKLHEQSMKFTQSGMNALLGMWMAQTGNVPDAWK